MSYFDARIRLPGQTRLPVNVVVDISGDRIKFIKDDVPLGDWLLDKVEVDVRSDTVYLTIEQEEVVLKVADSTRFVEALRANRVPAATTPPEGPDEKAVPAEESPEGGLANRLRGIKPEERFEDIQERIAELARDLNDETVSPPDVFRRWLRLLKEINVRHGQGAMPTPLFYRLNTQLLDLIPVPKSEPSPELRNVGTGPRL
ncbi:MAG: hypothetical protein ACLFWH_14920 [Actinomycetota bacterium]